MSTVKTYHGYGIIVSHTKNGWYSVDINGKIYKLRKSEFTIEKQQEQEQQEQEQQETKIVNYLENIEIRYKYDFCDAVRTGNIKWVEFMIDKSKKFSNDTINIEESLREAGKSGSLEIIKLIMKNIKNKKNKKLWDLIALGACKGQHMSILKLAIENGVNWWNDLLYNACLGGSLEIIEYIIKNHLVKFQYALEGACLGGHLDIVELYIEKDDNFDWNSGLNRACIGGYLDIVNIMIEKGANNWNYGLDGACIGGNIEIANLMIEKGANNFDYCLESACKGGNIEIVRLMLKNRRRDIDNFVLFIACVSNSLEIVELIFNKIEKERGKGKVGELENALQYACRNGNKNIINFILTKMTEYHIKLPNVLIMKYTIPTEQPKTVKKI